MLNQSALTISIDLKLINSNKKLILIQIQLFLLYILNPQIFINIVSLVDSDCTAVAFADEVSIINIYNITIKKLLALRLLYLVDGVPALFITDYFTIWMFISAHTETMLFFMIKLLLINLIILSISWLQRYKSCLYFKELRVYFNSDYCTEHCFLQEIANYNRYTL